MTNNSVIILGWVNKGKVATDGESVKNQVIINRLKELGIKVYILDFFHWKKHPWVLISSIICLLRHWKTPLILSSSAQNIYPLMVIHNLIHSHRRIIHWVIGGSFANKVKENVFKPKYINGIDLNIVESQDIVDVLHDCDVKNVIKVTNFKPIKELPLISKNDSEQTIFVFLSRIMPEKGVDYIIEAVRNLNEFDDCKGRYIVDFYGKIQENYRSKFLNEIDTIPNVNYKGFLNFNKKSSYDKLSKYNAMLFPTYWKGEGFAGIFIDAFIAGVPILASRWGHNEESISEGNTGLFFDAKSECALEEMMRKVITKEIDLTPMYAKCQKEAKKYDVKAIVTQEFCNKILFNK